MLCGGFVTLRYLRRAGVSAERGTWTITGEQLTRANAHLGLATASRGGMDAFLARAGVPSGAGFCERDRYRGRDWIAAGGPREGTHEFWSGIEEGHAPGAAAARGGQ